MDFTELCFPLVKIKLNIKKKHNSKISKKKSEMGYLKWQKFSKISKFPEILKKPK